MNKKSLRSSWRKGDMGLGQIAAVLLIVLPMLAFSVTFLIAYWNVMQIDYKLKLVANMSADYANGIKDTTNIDPVSLNKFLSNAGKLCPNNTSLIVTKSGNGATSGVIDLYVEYTTPNTRYFGNKKMTTAMHTYSYNDQNLSVTLTCK